MEKDLEEAQQIESNEVDDLIDLLGDINITDQLVTRKYQQEIIEQCFKHNSIIFLGTGTGKTYIAVEVIKRFKSQILGNYFGPDMKERTEFKRTFFLCNMVPLAIQQEEYVQTHLGNKFRVRRVIGADLCDKWDRDCWHDEFQKYHVFVVTGEILRKLLVNVTIRMQDINLLIFDEAHHVSKDDIYKQIMDLYHKERAESGKLTTRIIGLTASLLNEKKMDHKLDDKLENLATIYNSSIITAKNFVEVDEHCARPDFSTLPHLPQILDSRHEFLKDKLKEFSDFLESTSGVKWKSTDTSSKMATLSNNNHLWHQDQNFEIQSLQCLKRLGNKLTVVVEQLGPRIAYSFAINLQKKLTSYYNYIQVEHLQAGICCLLTIIDRYLKSWKDIEPDIDDVSDKVKVFYNELKEANGMPNFCGITFIKDRVIAHMLNGHLREVAASNKELSHIKSSYCTGQSTNTLFPEVDFDAESQMEVLRKFREGEFNFLIATEVLLEGFNMPQCNLVITFDKIDHFRYFTQSRGRARAKGGHYKNLVLEEDNEIRMKELVKYDQFELHLRNFVLENFVYVDRKYTEPDNIPPPLKTDIGATITYEQSVPYVYQYCQNLVDGVSLDKFTVWAPVFRVYRREEVQGESSFFCVITMPKCCYALTEDVTSEEWVTSKRAAQRYAALNVCKKLYELDEIDENLEPKYKLVKLFKQRQRGVSAGRLDYRGKKTYDIVVPKLLQKTPPTEATSYFLYPIDLMRTDTHTTHGMGILSNSCFNTLPPQFELRDSINTRSKVTVQMRGPFPVELTPEASNKLLSCYETLIKSIFPLPTKFLEFTSKGNALKNYIIVPIHPDRYEVDYEQVNTVLQSHPMQIPKCISTSLQPKEYIGMYVRKNYFSKFENEQYIVVNAGTDISINSTFKDESKADTYKEYFQVKYGVEMKVTDQPYLEVEPYKFVLPSYTRKMSFLDGDCATTKRRSTIYLFPEIVEELSLYRNVSPDLLLLPSILHKIESYLLVIEFRDKLFPGTTSGFMDLNQLYGALTLRRCQEELDLERLEFLGDTCLKFLACISLYCCNTTASQALLTLRKSICVSNKQLVQVAVKNDLNLPAYMRGKEFVARNNWVPPLVVPIQEILNKSASCVSNEDTMDVASDSVVKLGEEITDMEIDNVNIPDEPTATTTTTTTTTTTVAAEAMDTGKQNVNSIDTSNDVTKTPAPESSYLRQSLANKSIADSFEATIGAILMSGGLPVALNFLDTYGSDELFVTIEGTPLGLKIPSAMPVEGSKFEKFLQRGGWLRDIFSYTTPVIEWNSAQKVFYERNHQKDVRSLARDKLEMELELTLNHEAILLEALTHDSYNLGTVSLTRSYQRLEFLGDAVLDYLVTAYIMCNAPESYQPKDLHILRACVVSNRNFARLAVNLDISSDLIFSNQHLGKEIKDFTDYIKNTSYNSKKFYQQELAYLLEQKRIRSKFQVKDKPVTKLTKAPKALGDIFESTVCAIFLISNFNLEVVWKCLERLLKASVNEYLEAYKLTKATAKEEEVPPPISSGLA